MNGLVCLFHRLCANWYNAQDGFFFPHIKKKEKITRGVFSHTERQAPVFRSLPRLSLHHWNLVWLRRIRVYQLNSLSEKDVFGLQRTFVIDKQGMDADCPVEEFFLRGSVWGPASIWFNSEDIDYARSLCVQHSANAAENELEKTRGARSLPVRKEGEGAQPFLSQAVGKAPQPDKVASIVTI